MKILVAGLSGLVCAVLGAVLAGWIASLCVTWYHISSFEGGSGYYVVFLALGGCIAGFLTGTVATGLIVAQGGSPGKGIGVALSLVGGLALFALLLAWTFGDVPPKLRGDTVMLMVELRAPKGWRRPIRIHEGRNWVEMAAVNRRNIAGRSTSSGVDWEEVREEDGQVVIPGANLLFRTSPQWAVALVVAGENEARFLIPLSGRLSAEYEQWSAWLPQLPEGAAAEAARGFQYRFRVQRRGEWNAERRAAQNERRAAIRARFDALSDDAPLRNWLEFRHKDNDYTYMVSNEMEAKAAQVLRERVDEYLALLLDEDSELALQALEAFPMLRVYPEEAIATMRAVAGRLASELQMVNRPEGSATTAEERGVVLYRRLERWGAGWRSLVNDTSREGAERLGTPPELSEILEAARGHESIPSVQEIRTRAEQFERDWAPVNEPTTGWQP